MVCPCPEELEGTELQYRDHPWHPADERLQELLDIPANRKVIEFSQISRDGEGQPVAYDVKFVPYARAYPSVESEIRYAVLPGSDLCQAVLVFGVFPDHGHGRRGGGRTGAGAGVPRRERRCC